MRPHSAILFALLLTAPAWLLAKGKDKPTFPPAILAAQSVSVIIDPNAGVSPDDPFANDTARKDVERALLSWGRFRVVTVGQPADLVIVIRRGSGKLVNGTIRDPQQNDRIGAVTTTDDSVQIGGRQGRPSDPTTPNPVGGSASPQLEVGRSDDQFIVYDGTVANPIDSPSLWRYSAPDALHSHSVPAVDQFRRAIAAAEKAAAKKKP